VAKSSGGAAATGQAVSVKAVGETGN